VVFLVALAGSLLPQVGCSASGSGTSNTSAAHDQNKSLAELSEEAPAVFGTAPRTSAASAGAAWSIIIAAIAETEPEIAKWSLEQVQTVGGLPGAFLERRGKRLVVSYGQYSSPGSAEAQRDLAKVRGLEVEGGFPFGGAMLAPPPIESLGSFPEFDLAGVKDQPGGRRAMYTLQVGIYGRGDGKDVTPAQLAEFRAAAEKAVIELRRQGDEAFYYHGPARSTVTVGLFGDKDYVFTRTTREGSVSTTAPRESFQLTELRKRHPYNLLNGKGIRTKARDGKATMQPSLVVPIPK